MENEKIIVKDHDISACLAALSQSKGNIDPSVLMSMMNNGGMNGGWWWIFILFLMWGWGGYGNNRNNQQETNSDFARLAAMGNQNNNTDLLMSAIQGNKEAINTLASNINVDHTAINNAICAINSSVDKLSGQVGLSSERVINAITSGNAALASQLATACCTTQRSIDTVNLNLTKQSYEDQLAVCNQTNTLLNTMNQNTLQLRDAGQANTQSLLAKIDQFENLYRQDKYDNLLAMNTSLVNELSQLKQNQYIASTVTAPLIAQINSLQSQVSGIVNKMPNTVPVVYPQISAVNTSAFNSAALGAAYGTNLADGGYYGSNCNC